MSTRIQASSARAAIDASQLQAKIGAVQDILEMAVALMWERGSKEGEPQIWPALNAAKTICADVAASLDG